VYKYDDYEIPNTKGRIMAVVKFCDWLKIKIPQNEKTFTISVDGQKFEVSEQGRRAILLQLEGDVPALMPRTISEVELPPQSTPLDIPASDPFDVQPTPAPITPRVFADTPELKPMGIPDDWSKPLPPPTAEQRKRVLRESVVAPPGTLDVLGNPQARKEAMRKLQEFNHTNDETYRQENSGNGINIGKFKE